MADDRENVMIQVDGKSFTIDAPKGLPDDEVLRRAMRADTEFASLSKTNERLAGLAASEQAHAKSSVLPPPKRDILSNIRNPDQKAISAYQNMGEEHEIAEGAPPAARAMITAGAGGEAAALVKGGGVASYLLRSAAIGGGTAAGSVASDIATGHKPDMKSAAKLGIGASAGNLLLEPLIAAGTSLIRPFLQKAPTPITAASDAALASGVAKRTGELKAMASAEEGIRQTVTAAPRAIRKNIIDPLYPKVKTPVDIYPAARQAIESTGKQIAHGTPSELVRTKNIGKQIEQVRGALLEQLGTDASLRSAGLPGVEPSQIADTLQALQEKRAISFSQAQELRAALGRAMAKGQGFKTPAEVYQSLRGVHDLVDDGMRMAAKTDGVLPQWEQAQKVYKQFMDDFYNKNAPLKGVLDLKEGMTGQTLRRLTTPGNINRAEAALRRYGLKDAADALRKVADNPGSKDAIKDMERVVTSSKGFREAELTSAREADTAKVEASQKESSQAKEEIQKARSKRLKMLGIGGGGAAYEAYRLLRPPEAPRP
jgi:hypothetical protein